MLHLLTTEQKATIAAAARHVSDAIGASLAAAVELILKQPALLGKIAADLRLTASLIGAGQNVSAVADDLDKLEGVVHELQGPQGALSAAAMPAAAPPSTPEDAPRGAGQP